MSTAISNVLKTGHVGLNVTNLERSKQFYTDVFGFEIAHESTDEKRRFVFLGDGARLVLTLWQQSDGRFEKSQPGLHHLSFQVDGIHQVEALEGKLRSLNVPIIYDGIVPHDEGQASGGIFFEDPDGIRLEVYSPSGAEGRTAPHQDAPSCGFF
jgi:lactoylglutathione lyase